MGSIPSGAAAVAGIHKQGKRATEKSLAQAIGRIVGGLNAGRDGRKAGGFMCSAQKRILSRGFGPTGSLNLALVGSLLAVTQAAGGTTSGDRVKRPAAKSSTMKGAKALESEPLMETVPNREKPSLVGNGALLVSAPRNRARTISSARGKYGWAGARHIECGAEVGPPSNVTSRVKPSLIREGALLPPVVRRCLGGIQVIQRQRTGRVAQVGAAWLLEREASGRVRCKAVAGSFQCPGGTGRVTDDERADGFYPTSTSAIAV